MSCFVITGGTVKQLSLVKCMRGSRTFCQGGPGQSDKKSSDVCFFFFFFFFFFFESSAHFTEAKWSISKKSIIFQGSRGGPTFSRWGGGSNFFQGGPIAYSL